jgi:hypothetical protein
MGKNRGRESFSGFSRGRPAWPAQRAQRRLQAERLGSACLPCCFPEWSVTVNGLPQRG